MKFLITGGLGFIGTNLINFLIDHYDHEILNLDKVTYASNFFNNKKFSNYKFYNFVKGDISDKNLVKKLLEDFKPDFIMNLAAESHVDRSISSPDAFVNTNILGTYNLLINARDYWDNLSGEKKKKL